MPGALNASSRQMVQRGRGTPLPSCKGRRDEDDEGSLLSASPANNVNSLVLRDQGIMRFVKYAGCSAPGSRWDIAVECRG